VPAIIAARVRKKRLQRCLAGLHIIARPTHSLADAWMLVSGKGGNQTRPTRCQQQGYTKCSIQTVARRPLSVVMGRPL
jgi:hypothetical protein